MSAERGTCLYNEQGDEQYGNGVQATFAYDALNRPVGRWACLYTTHAGCAAGYHLEGSYAVFTGNKVTRLINEQGDNTLGYDDLGRLSSRVTAGGGPTLNWTYDRFGNRLSQTASGSGSGSFPQPYTDVSPYNNKVNGYSYDLAGNLINDGVHTYSYDQEGNLIYVDGGQTTWDNYDALNRRILHVTGNFTNYKRYAYDGDGRLAGVWQDEGLYQNLARYYGPKGDSFAYWTNAGDQVHYQHTDYLGTVKARTDPNHNLEGTYSDLPFGERTAAAGTDDNTEHYAMLDRDSESDTHHAQFRTYEPRIGRWLQPDPYDGSYDYNNPQSWNRYSYIENDPLSAGDPSGLKRPSTSTQDDLKMCGEMTPVVCSGASGGSLMRITSNSYFTGGFGANNEFAWMDVPVEKLQYGENRFYIGSGTVRGTSYSMYGLTPGWGYTQVGSGLDLYVSGVLGQSVSNVGTPVRGPQSAQPDPDDERIRQLAVAVNHQAGWVGTGKGIAGFYAASLVGAVTSLPEVGITLAAALESYGVPVLKGAEIAYKGVALMGLSNPGRIGVGIGLAKAYFALEKSSEPCPIYECTK